MKKMMRRVGKRFVVGTFKLVFVPRVRSLKGMAIHFIVVVTVMTFVLGFFAGWG